MAGAIASLFVEIGAHTSGLESGLAKAQSGLTGLAGSAKGLMANAATGFGMALAAPVLSSMGGVFQSITTGVMGTNAAMQDSQTAWGVLLGSADAAKAKMQDLYNFGATTPFNFEEVDKADRMLMQFGGTALATDQTLTMVGNAASGTGYRFQDVAFWTGRLYDAIQNGQPFGDAMMNLQQMGVISGETRNKLEALQKSGAKGPEIWAAYTASQQKFGGMMDKQSQTFNGLLSTMQDSINQLLATAGKPIFDAMSAGLGKLVNLLSSPAVLSFATNISQHVASGLTSLFDAIKGAVPKVQEVFSALAAVFKSLGSGDFNSAFGPIMAAIDKAFGPEVAGKVTIFVSNVLRGLQLLRDGVITVSQALHGEWIPSSSINPFVNALGIAATKVREFGTFLQGLWTQAQPIFSRITGLLGPFAAGFASVFAAVGAGAVVFAVLTPIIGAVAAAIGFLTSPIMLVAAAVGLLAVAWTTNFANIRGIVAGFVAFVQTAWATIGPALQAAGTAISGAIGGAFKAIVPLVQQFFAAFMQNLPAIQALWGQLVAAVQPIVPVLQMVGAVIGGVVVAAIGILLGAVGGLVGFLTGALPGAIQVASGVITVLGGVIQVIAAVVEGVVHIVADLFHGDWSAAWNDAKTMVAGVASGIQTIVSGLKTVVIGEFNALVGGVSGMVSGFVGVLAGYFSGLASATTGTVSSMATAVAGFFQNLGTNASTTISNMVTAVSGFFTNLGSNVSTAVTGMLQAVSDGFAKMLSSASTAVGDLASNVGTALGNMVSAAGTAIGNFASTITNGISNLAGEARSAAAGIGQAIVDGIAGAISGGAGAIIGAAKGAAESALSAAKSALGIKSPSKAFAEVGMYSMAGFAQGISANRGLATGAVSDAMNAAAGTGADLAGSLSLSGRAALAGSGGKTEIHVHVAGSVLAERDLREAVSQAYHTLERRGRI